MGSKITADVYCSIEIKRRLLLGRKIMTNLDSIWKSKDITLPTKVHLVKAMVFPVVMYGCESRTSEKLTHLKRPWCWERLKARGERDDRGWDGWMASLTQRTWVWQAPRVDDGQGSLECCSQWGHKELDTTEWLNWTVSYLISQKLNV